MEGLLLLTHCELVYSVKKTKYDKMIYNGSCPDQSQFKEGHFLSSCINLTQ